MKYLLKWTTNYQILKNTKLGPCSFEWLIEFNKIPKNWNLIWAHHHNGVSNESESNQWNTLKTCRQRKFSRTGSNLWYRKIIKNDCQTSKIFTRELKVPLTSTFPIIEACHLHWRRKLAAVKSSKVSLLFSGYKTLKSMRNYQSVGVLDELIFGNVLLTLCFRQ